MKKKRLSREGAISKYDLLKIQYTQKSPDAVHAKLTVETEEPFSTGRLMYEQFMRQE